MGFTDQEMPVWSKAGEFEDPYKVSAIRVAEKAVVEAAEATYDDTCYCTLCKAVAELKAARGGGGEDGRSKAG